MTKPAFTLAEVLITLGVIGVVAAMTMPTLIQNHKKHVVETRLQKFYSVISQALKQAEVDNGEFTTWTKEDMAYDENGELDYDKQESIAKNLFMKYTAPYLKYIKITDGEVTVDENGAKVYNRPIVYLADGTTFTIYNGSCLSHIIDIDGPKGSNVMGKDIFPFLICFSDNNRKSYCGSENILFCPYSDKQFLNNREKLKEKCQSEPKYCGSLIMHDGWKIKNDYPHRL